MGSSAGSGNTTQRVIQDLPEWSKPYWKGIAAQGRSIAREPYVQWEGPRIAKSDPFETKAIWEVGKLFDQGARPELAQAGGIATQASQIGFDTPMFPDQYQRYMNPALENVLGLGQERLMENFAKAMGESERGTSDAAIQAGVMGGRGNLLGARAAGEVSDEAFRAMREFEADTRFQAFDSAQQAFASDVAAKQAGARLGLDAGSQLRDLALTQQDQALARIDSLQQAGVRRREMEQAIINQAYEDFVARRDWKSNKLKEYVGILSGTPYASAMNQTQSASGGGPGVGQTIAGLGIAGLGAYGAYKGA